MWSQVCLFMLEVSAKHLKKIAIVTPTKVVKLFKFTHIFLDFNILILLSFKCNFWILHFQCRLRLLDPIEVSFPLHLNFDKSTKQTHSLVSKCTRQKKTLGKWSQMIPDAVNLKNRTNHRKTTNSLASFCLIINSSTASFMSHATLYSLTTVKACISSTSVVMCPMPCPEYNTNTILLTLRELLLKLNGLF